jgi:uncharacterized protein with FMN-binding domain
MSRKQPKGKFNPVRAIKKFLVSAFVVSTFVAYAVHEHFVPPDSASGALASQGANATQEVPTAPPTDVPSASQTNSSAAPQSDSAAAPPTDSPATAAPLPTNPPPPTPTTAPTVIVRAQGQYKDGAYTGPQVDAYWGVVQIKAVVRNGKIAQVTFLEYPSDRRTSQRINSIAMPYLQTEAVQVQSANVDLISGATLTSEAFAESLQAALTSAKN